jgi:hypothetical protein
MVKTKTHAGEVVSLQKQRWLSPVGLSFSKNSGSIFFLGFRARFKTIAYGERVNPFGEAVNVVANASHFAANASTF